MDLCRYVLIFSASSIIILTIFRVLFCGRLAKVLYLITRMAFTECEICSIRTILSLTSWRSQLLRVTLTWTYCHGSVKKYQLFSCSFGNCCSRSAESGFDRAELLLDRWMHQGKLQQRLGDCNCWCNSSFHCTNLLSWSSTVTRNVLHFAKMTQDASSSPIGRMSSGVKALELAEKSPPSFVMIAILHPKTAMVNCIIIILQ